LVRAGFIVGVLVVGMAIVWFGFRAALGTPTPFFVVSSGSMVPTLYEGDIIVVQDGGSFAAVREGDIIVFRDPVGRATELCYFVVYCTREPRVIVHRVVAVEYRGGQVFATKGDHNAAPDSWRVTEEMYIGRVVQAIPRLGYVTTWLQPPLNYILIGAILVTIFLSEFYAKDQRKQRSEPVAREIS
jgi:signal peptidase